MQRTPAPAPTVPKTAELVRAAGILLAATTALAACRPLAPAVSASRPALSAQASRGLAFAGTHCAECHGVTANSSSPHPESPPFDDIANKPGLDTSTFAAFLSDSHNFPAAMNFTVNPARIDDLTAYMLTLRRPGYLPKR
ncbi:MAG: cytochrome c [Sphingomonadales bacterium]|nr:cytochrome c [Sphingomonadales bacterium]MBU3992793.1 cytochrome c [Alphaproteobacteria bacterium]